MRTDTNNEVGGHELLSVERVGKECGSDGYLRLLRITGRRLQPPTPRLRRAEGEADPPPESSGGDLSVRQHSVCADRGKSSRSPLHWAAAYPLHPFIETAVNAGLTIPEGITP
jgi:hypothetical protein